MMNKQTRRQAFTVCCGSGSGNRRVVAGSPLKDLSLIAAGLFRRSLRPETRVKNFEMVCDSGGGWL
jgi:hypothetical protein